MKKNGPWTIKSSELKYKNPWIEVREDQVIQPDGKDGIYSVISVGSGISVIPIDEDGRLYLLKEFKYPMEGDSIETVAGMVEKGETYIQAAKRELKEELGVEAEEFIELGTTYSLTTYMKAPNCLFLARKLHFGESRRDGTELMETLETSVSDAVRMVMDGRIDNQKTCMCILKVNEYLRAKGV